MNSPILLQGQKNLLTTLQGIYMVKGKMKKKKLKRDQQWARLLKNFRT
jgi:hypothetical protein